LTEAIAGTVLSSGQADIIGDIHATPDEFAWLDIGYTSAKLVAFLATSWLMGRHSPRMVMAGAALLMGGASAASGLTIRLDVLVGLRVLQGLAGGTLLVAGQVLVFVLYPRRWQPLLQAAFAVAAVVAPATMAPALHGWLVDEHDWTWIVLCVAPVALLAAGLLFVADLPEAFDGHGRGFDAPGFALASVAAVCIVYLLSQGSRWDWFGEPHVVWLALVGAGALAGFVWLQVVERTRRLLAFGAFRSADFSFAFAVSFVAGAALFGSAYLIPSFAVSLLAFTPTDAGFLLLPSGVAFVGSLLLAAFLFQARGVPPIATVPLGIIMVMGAMWLLAGSNGDSGAASLGPAVLLRGLGLGFLFLSITLVAFGDLERGHLASGIGLFDAGRQLGGLGGVAALQTLIDRHIAGNATVLGASLNAGNPAVSERLAGIAALLAARGLDAAEAGRAAAGLLGRTLIRQATVIAFDTAFLAVALLFVVAAPVLVAIKVVLRRLHEGRSRA
jgi:MFS transporter, DHA2 family, multidrug resistance protein